MGLSIGQIAPEFSLPSTSGNSFELTACLGKPLVLYFYPKDFTAVCSKQACAFRDQFSHLRELSIPVYGVSRDSIQTHLRFKEEHRLPFDLLADEDGAVSRLYKARIPLLGLSKRITYLIDGAGKIALAHDELLGSESHVEEVLKGLS